MDFQSESRSGSPWLLYSYFFGTIIFFVVLSLRLFQLTIVKGEYYRRVAEGNRIREVIIEPKRGRIVDRRGTVIAQNLAVDVQGTGMRLTSKRVYEQPQIISAVVGYRQVADTKDIVNDPCVVKITLGDKVGKKGIEKLFECELRGKNGRKLVEVDASGKPIRTLSVIPPTDGQTIQLSIDLELQKKAVELLQNRKGSFVAFKPQTGELLALVSSPGFNSQDFEDGNEKEVKNYLTSPDKPLFNRAVEGTYPPGSVFKPVVAVAALEEKKVDENFEVEDTGVIKAGATEFGNWLYRQYGGRTEGRVNMVKGISRSNDIYFYRIGEKLGDSAIKKWAEIFGYGKQTGLGLEEAEGTVPSGFWKEEILHEPWYLGDTYNYSIGQGYLLVTPLQLAHATIAFANNGHQCKPKLLKVGANSGVFDQKQNVAECHKLPISDKTLKVIHEGMRGSCTAGRGVTWPLFNFPIPIACKSGTAESSLSGTHASHAWLTAYAPAEPSVGTPEIQVTVMMEEAGQGSDVGGPIVRDFFKAYFERKQ